MAKFAITTTDNPFSPFTQFREWYKFDIEHGYYTSEWLAKLSSASNGLSESLNEMSDENAIDEMIRLNLTGKYKKVTRKDYPKFASSIQTA